MISFVLPVYNCYDSFREYFPAFINWLNSHHITYEIIVVDDHSHNSQSVKDLVNAPGCMYLYNEKNSGKGYSVKKGCMVANGEWIVFMDGDFPFDFVVIEKMIPDFLNENIDMIIGDRTQKDSSYPSDLPLMRKMGSRVLSAIAGRFFTGNFFDTQCGIKAFRKPVAADLFGQLTQNRFSFDLEILFLATRKKLKITRVAVLVRHQSNSTVRIFKDGLGMGMALVVIYFNKISGYYKI